MPISWSVIPKRTALKGLLASAVARQFKEHEAVIIVDCHFFMVDSDIAVLPEHGPDICIFEALLGVQVPKNRVGNPDATRSKGDGLFRNPFFRFCGGTISAGLLPLR